MVFALLYNVCQLMADKSASLVGIRPIFSFAKYDMASIGKGPCIDASSHLLGATSRMELHVAEVIPEAGLEEVSERFGQCPSAGAGFR
jgi:hypothetical protein